MKRIVTSIVLLAVISAASFFSVFAVNDVTDSIISKVDSVEALFGTDGCVSAAEELMSGWSRFLDKAVLVNDLGHALEISSSIAEIAAFARQNSEELHAACERARAQLKMFKSSQTPTLMRVL